MRIAAEGVWLVAPFAIAAVLAGFGGKWVFSAVLAVFALAFAWFFRDPGPKAVPAWDERTVYSPADGRVMEIAEEEDAELGGRWRKIRIFLAVWNVHVQRAPLPCVVEQTRYRPGKFLRAYEPQAHAENEQNLIRMNGPFRWAIRQVAGILARRIRCDVKPGDHLRPGDRLGMILFGSQVEVALPASAEVRVKAGDRVRLGRTAIAAL